MDENSYDLPEFKKRLPSEYSDDYVRKVFLVWYNNGKPGATRLREKIEPNSEGDTPVVSILNTWITNDFMPYSLELDTQIAEQIEGKLISDRMEALKRHASLGHRMQDIGLEYFEANGITNLRARDAITLMFQGAKLERESLVVPTFFDKLAQMDDSEIIEEIKRLSAGGTLSDIDDEEDDLG